MPLGQPLGMHQGAVPTKVQPAGAVGCRTSGLVLGSSSGLDTKGKSFLDSAHCMDMSRYDCALTYR